MGRQPPRTCGVVVAVDGGGVRTQLGLNGTSNRQALYEFLEEGHLKDVMAPHGSMDDALSRIDTT